MSKQIKRIETMEPNLEASEKAIEELSEALEKHGRMRKGGLK